MRSVFVVVCFKLSLAPFYAARSSLTAFAGGFSVEKALNKKLFVSLSGVVVRESSHRTAGAGFEPCSFLSFFVLFLSRFCLVVFL